MPKKLPISVPALDALLLPKFKASGSLEDRREFLHDTFALLRKKNVDLDAVFDVLAIAKREKIYDTLKAHQIDFSRDFEDERKKASVSLKHFCRYLKSLNPDNVGGIPILDEAALLIEKLQSHGPRRRTRAGHQPEPWLKEARKKLAQVRVPEETREELLAAIGLTRS